jgi:hypothetical protein
VDRISAATADRARSTMEDLHQLTAAARLYGLAHPKTSEVAQRLTGSVAELLDELGELEVHVRRDGLDVEGVEVFGDDDNKEGIARTLHREGITSFVFLQGLTRKELTTFSELLGLNLSLPQWEEETLSSLLWQAQLEHVVYEAVEHLSDAQELSETAARGEEGYIHEMVAQILDPSAFAGAMDVEMMGSGPSEGYAVAGPGMRGEATETAVFAGGEQTGSVEAREELAVPEAAWTPSQHIAALDLTRWAEEPDAELEEEVDLEALRREAAEDTPVSILGRVVSLLLVAAARGRDELPTAEAMAMLTRALERDEAHQGHLWRVCMDLGLRLSDSEVPLLKAGRRGLHEWLELCTRPDTFAAFAGSLAQDRPMDVKLLHRYLTAGDGQRAHLVIQRLGGQTAARRLGWVMDEVASVVRSDLHQLTAGLERRPVDEVLQVIDLLRRMGDDEAIGLMRKLLRHPVSDVRAAVIKALPDPLPKPLLTPVMSLLSDDSATVRQAVVDLLRTRKPVGAFDAIQTMVRGSMFANGKPSKKMILATALGASGGDAAIPAIATIMDQYGLLSGPRAKPDLEACAAALAVIDTLKARQRLKRGAKSLNPYIRGACRDALEGRSS